jgi:RNA ligase
MANTEFRKFPSIPRLRRTCTISEKIDGTNACVVILTEDQLADQGVNIDYVPSSQLVVTGPDVLWVGAQSRNKFITPGKSTDNHGFAEWAYAHTGLLAATLGTGYHYGEWWGSGIQRGYGLPSGDKRFSLFNTHRWEVSDNWSATRPYSLGIVGCPELCVVPALYTGPFSDTETDLCVNFLKRDGSAAAPGFPNPEGIIIYHHAAKQLFKYTLDGDGHKSA